MKLRQAKKVMKKFLSGDRPRGDTYVKAVRRTNKAK